jgi:hypothetical protein
MAETLVKRLLGAADSLLREGTRSSAFKRRAVSTAYYAAFHSLAKACADQLLSDTAHESDEYLRVYRALDHGPIKDAFTQAPLKGHSRLGRIGDLVAQLQNERYRADYFPPIKNVFTLRRARELVDLSREVVEQIEALDIDDRRTLSVCLLFRTRGSKAPGASKAR